MTTSRELILQAGQTPLPAILTVPHAAQHLVIFSHGSGSSRMSPRNQQVAAVLQKSGIATLLADLLTTQEDAVYDNRFDIELLTQRLMSITNAVIDDPLLRQFRLGYFGASTGAASALKAAARLGDEICAVVCRGGRPDMAMDEIDQVVSPTLFIVGGLDAEVLRLNEIAFARMRSIKRLKVIHGASHLFEEPGMLPKVAELAREWFQEYFQKGHDAVH